MNAVIASVLLDDTFFEVFGQVCSHLCGCAFRCHLSHVVVYHDLDKFFKGSGVGIPAEFGFGFGRIAQKIDDVGGAVEVG